MTDRRPLIVLGALFAIMLSVWFATRITDVPANNQSAAINDSGPVSSLPATAPEDWHAGLERLTATENALFAHPDPTRVGEIMTEACTCYGDTRSRLNTLITENSHVDGDNVLINSAVLSKEITPDNVTAIVTVSSNGKPVVDSNGHVLSPSPEVHESRLLYVLVRGSDQKWRIATRGPAPETGGGQ